DFILNLKKHLLQRIMKVDENKVFTVDDLLQISFRAHRLYTHKTMRINYTTYDLQRDQDTINPRRNRYLMVLSQDDEHPFLYAEVISILHANIGHPDLPGGLERMEFLYVRWLDLDPSHLGGMDTKRLHRVKYLDHNNGDAFGFLDPQLVVCATHLIPAFYQGHTKSYLPRSLIRPLEQNDEDWCSFYVNL
ncbi:hypothetical protein GGX14DRAFT_359390, partial [Mycena pura]